jgi:deoxyribodipyrimidine photolyase-related protein
MKLRLILGDQLNYDHSWFSKIDSDVMYLMMEVKEETSQVINHIQKVVGFFLARRNFSNFLEKKGHRIIYFKIDDYNNKQTFVSNLLSIIKEHNVDEFEYLEPDDYSLNLELKKFSNKVPISTKMVSTEHFLTGRSELRHFFEGKKAYLMESFYRYMRKKYKILVDNNQKPIGGRWNFDSENRKSLPNDLIIPNPLLLEHNVEDILKVINKVNIQTFGNIDPSAFIWPINRQESLQLLEDFIHNRLLYTPGKQGIQKGFNC